jgi:hypothetical protein
MIDFRRSLRISQKELALKRKKTVCIQTISNYRHRENISPYHMIRSPFITPLNKQHRLDLAYFLSDYRFEHWENFVFSDEFFFYSMRKHNSKNDIIWGKSVSDLKLQLLHRNARGVSCVGVFIAVSSRSMTFVIKKKGQSWNKEYFCDTIIPHVADFVENADNVPNPSLVTFVHDCAPGWAAGITQETMIEEQIDFIHSKGFGRWPGNSPDLNPAENLGSILKDQLQCELDKFDGDHKYSVNVLMRILRRILRRMKKNTKLLNDLVLSFPSRLQKVKESNGSKINY